MDDTRSIAAPDTGSFFYGWVIVGAVFFMLLVTAGLGFYNASVILSAAADELNTEVGTVSFGPTLFFGISGITGFVLSKRMELVDIRWFYVSGGVLGAAALAGLRFVDSVAALYVFFALFGVGFALAGLVPSTTLIARWFNKRRSVALSVGSTGLSVGGILLTPVAASYIEDHDLAAASPWMALVWFFGVVPIALLLIRSFPSDKGLQPDGAPAPATVAAIPGATLSEATATRFFQMLCITYAMIFLAQVGGIAQLFNLAKERTDADIAATVLSTMALSSVIGRLVGGVVVIRLSTKLMTSALTVVQAIALALIAFADTRAMLLVSAAIFGLSVGNLLMLQPLLIAEAFGVKQYSRIYSLNQLFGTIGVALGPFVLGLLHDWSNYETAFLFGSAANLIGLTALFLAGSTMVPQAMWSHEATAPTPA
ncbi:MAG: MFS transporter [Acidimicrobiales bacterium]